MLSIEQKHAQFAAFYLIAHPIKANVLPCKPEQANYSLQDFEESMPYAFKIAGEMSEIQSQTLKPLRKLGDRLEDLVDYLQFQARKIDLMMSYILQQQDQVEHQATAIKFGGGGVVIEFVESSHDIPTVGQAQIIKLFLETESAAIYSFAEVIEVNKSGESTYEVSYIYTHIREQDQELLVRASLHLQTSALRKQNAEKRQHANNTDDSNS